MPITRRSFTTTLAASSIPVLMPHAAVGAVPIERVVRHVLPNGLEVIAIPDHRVPVVTHMIWYRVGSADEVPGKSGIAHFLEHLMFKGTTRAPGDTFSTAVTAVGGTENAFTSYDYTGYFQRVAREHLSTMMDFEADRMTGLVLTDAVVDPERDVVLEERKSRTDNDPGARLSETFSNTLWRDHPYGIPVIGWEREIRQLNRDDALAFYRRHYAPNNAVLVVAGDVTPDEILRFAETSYGVIPANPAITPRTRPPAPVHAKRERVRLADARVAQPSMTHAVIVPSYATAAQGEAEAFEILGQVAGSSPNGRIFKALVADQGLAAGAGAFYAGAALGDGRFGVYASPRPGVTLERLEAAMVEVTGRLVRDGITEEELARAKTRLVADSIFSQDSQASMARMYGSALVCGSTVADLQDWTNRVRKVTLAEVHAVAARALDLDRAVTAELVRQDHG
ncbi:M16 family metallopeptidase [Phreatobacter stygius]|uniref:Insulinase family protein n=1 Tax=Phreatobacter stygius TaxID=1940610 RepID=A0A4D7B5Q5_9HYPH|nr:pitrilysin family protein [Phreatobacter stygius]QCI65738.1 insulinase family protein [Phreatobacter stygius]